MDTFQVHFRIDGIPGSISETITSDMGDDKKIYEDLLQHMCKRLKILQQYMSEIKLTIFMVSDDIVARDVTAPGIILTADTTK